MSWLCYRKQVFHSRINFNGNRSIPQGFLWPSFLIFILVDCPYGSFYVLLAHKTFMKREIVTYSILKMNFLSQKHPLLMRDDSLRQNKQYQVKITPISVWYIPFLLKRIAQWQTSIRDSVTNDYMCRGYETPLQIL